MLEAPWRLPKHTALPGDRQWQQEPVPLCTVEVLLFPGPDDWNFSGWDQRTLLMPFHCRERQAGFWMPWYLQPDIYQMFLFEPHTIQGRASGCFFLPMSSQGYLHLAVPNLIIHEIDSRSPLYPEVAQVKQHSHQELVGMQCLVSWCHGYTDGFKHLLSFIGRLSQPQVYQHRFIWLCCLNAVDCSLVFSSPSYPSIDLSTYLILPINIPISMLAHTHMYIDSRHIEYINMYMYMYICMLYICVCVHGYNCPFLRLVHQFLLHMRRSSADCKAFFRNPGVQMSQSVEVIKYHFLVVWHRWSNST